MDEAQLKIEELQAIVDRLVPHNANMAQLLKQSLAAMEFAMAAFDTLGKNWQPVPDGFTVNSPGMQELRVTKNGAELMIWNDCYSVDLPDNVRLFYVPQEQPDEQAKV